MAKKIQISPGKFIGDDQPCFIIAEIGINHNGDVTLAKKTIDAAKKAGVDAVKFQTFRTDHFISDRTITHTYKSQGETVTESMYEMFKRCELSREGWMEIIEHCKEQDILFFSTPEDPEDLEFLLDLTSLPLIKVGSDDLINLDLMAYYGAKKKPMIISAGMAYIGEVEDAIQTIYQQGNDEVVVLHCVSSYPTQAKECNLQKIKTIRQAFDVVAGFSDHSEGIVAAIGAVSLGARVLEKHFTLSRSLPGPDHWFSSDPEEMAELVASVRFVEESFGVGVLGPVKDEQANRQIYRRSIVARHNLSEGHILTEADIVYKRPGTGIKPKDKSFILGRKIARPLHADEMISLDSLE